VALELLAYGGGSRGKNFVLLGGHQEVVAPVPLFASGVSPPTRLELALLDPKVALEVESRGPAGAGPLVARRRVRRSYGAPGTFWPGSFVPWVAT
jgi:hypothetical protein